MGRTAFSGREIVAVLRSFGCVPLSRSGSHVRLCYENTDTDEVRNVDVPMHDEVKIGTLRSIANQCGAEDFQEWCRWIDDTPDFCRERAFLHRRPDLTSSHD